MKTASLCILSLLLGKCGSAPELPGSVENSETIDQEQNDESIGKKEVPIDADTPDSGDSDDQRIFVDPSGVVVNGAKNKELDAIRKCLVMWGHKSPFGGRIDNFKRVLGLKVGAIGLQVSDYERTKKEKLILIKSSFQYNASSTFNLMNPNGYYCIQGGMAIGSSLKVNIHCKANIASARVAIDFGNLNEKDESKLQININANTDLNFVKPVGDSCGEEESIDESIDERS